jgi:hypothetical protein
MSLISSQRRLSGVALCLLLAGRAPADQPTGKKLDDKVREIAGTAEFLRSVPKHFATLKSVDAAKRQVTLLIEGEVLPKVWPLAPDGELKVMGWWGRLSDFTLGDRVWVWFKTDRKKNAVAISMLADEISEQDIHGEGLTVVASDVTGITVTAGKGQKRILKVDARYQIAPKEKIFLQSKGGKARFVVLNASALEELRAKQKALMRQRWAKEGLPGTAGFIHIFSGEMDLLLDHEAMRWGRALRPGDKVTLVAEPPIKALVKHVRPWRERTEVRLVVHSLDLADLTPGQRLHLLCPPPPDEVDRAALPPDLDRPRSKQERVEWFLATIYCTCAVKGDRCTGHFYTLASCNPNGCGMPNAMRRALAEKIDRGLTDRQIFEELLKEHGPLLLRPHLLP